MKEGGVSRKDFIQGALASMGLGFVGSRPVFAAPPGWKPGMRPNMSFGVMSDVHMRVHYDGVNFYRHGDTVMGDMAVKALLGHFKAERVDAVLNCGDICDRGMIREMEFYREAFDKVYGDGPRPVSMIAVGNHDVEKGFDYWAKGVARSEDPAVYDRIRLGPNLKPAMERIWGEPYEDVWHRTVKGVHFFGYGWGLDPDGRPEPFAGRLYHDTPMEGRPCSSYVRKGLLMAELVRREREAGRLDPMKPFFIAYHCNVNRYDKRGAVINTALASALGVRPGGFCNGLGLFGHGHRSNAEWFFFWDSKALFPSFQVGSLADWKERGGGWERFAQGFGDGKVEGRDNRTLALLVKVYPEFMTLRNLWVGPPGDPVVANLGPALVLPFSGFTPGRHPAQFDNLARVVGRPEFPDGAKLEVRWRSADVRLSIPKADGNRRSRVYGYNVEVVGTGGKAVRRNVLAKGYSYGDGHEPDGGVTEAVFRKTELPPGKEFVFRVHPSSAFAERGRPLEKTDRCIRVSLRNFAPDIDRDAKFAVTKGAGLTDDDRVRLVVDDVPPWVKWVDVENGEVVVAARPVRANERGAAGR